ncbi:MAG TPA: hypothetical protein VMW08_17055 [Acidimicrobiales bacterium]|nr:hypothetical protein [Acidimicrobiales bacterium]
MFVDRHDDEDDGGADATTGDDMKRCPSCGDHFIATATRCPTCQIDLVDGDEPAVYTFLMGDEEAVEALARLMRESQVPYDLVDDELIVSGTQGVATERVLDLLDEALGIAVEHGTPVEVVELWDWEDADLDRLEAELRVARIPHLWDDDDGFLLIPPAHLAPAEVVIDRVAHPDALDPDADPGPVGSPELMSDLFLAADALRREPWNLHAVTSLREVAAKAADSAPPFGVDATTWNLAVTTAIEAVETSNDGEGEDDAVKALAERVRAVLRPLV